MFGVVLIVVGVFKIECFRLNVTLALKGNLPISINNSYILIEIGNTPFRVGVIL
jgi:hypothetical protein